MEEIWKDVIGLEGLYMVSNLGRIKSLERKVNSHGWFRIKKESIRIPQNHNCGYKSISFGKRGQSLIHRLVAIAFLENPKNLEFVNHKNGIKTDNRIENLEWVTRQENEDHAFRTGLKKSYGEFGNSSKLKNWQVFHIKYCARNTDSKQLGLIHGVHRATIQRIWNGKIWIHI